MTTYNKLRIAAIDIGTNSIRFIVGEYQNGIEKIIQKGGKITRIGKDLIPNHELNPKTMHHTLDYLKTISQLFKELNVDHIVAVATNALRECSNHSEFITSAQQILDIPPIIITPDQEALFSFLGAKELIQDNNCMLVDLGGGSTEFVYIRGTPQNLISLKIGSVKMTEKFINNDPPLEEEQTAIRQYVKNLLAASFMENTLHLDKLIFTAGTATTLAAMDLGLKHYDQKKIHGHKIQTDKTQTWMNLLRKKTNVQRQIITGLHPDRADIIFAGITILYEIICYLSISEITISDKGLLYGVLRDKYQKLTT